MIYIMYYIIYYIIWKLTKKCHSLTPPCVQEMCLAPSADKQACNFF